MLPFIEEMQVFNLTRNKTKQKKLDAGIARIYGRKKASICEIVKKEKNVG